MSSFWSNWVIVLTAISIIGITWILFANRKTSEPREGATTGHEYDGIEELDNPLPAWWFYMFLATIVFSVGYLIAYPGMGNFKGLLDWTQHKQWQQQLDTAAEKYDPIFQKYAAMEISAVAQDPVALKMGQRLFSNNCAQCHGSDAGGSYGFPSLTDNDWLYGGSPKAIKHSIEHGRMGAMPGWGSALGDEGVQNVTAHVLNMSGRTATQGQAEAGKGQYAMFCVVCHGADGGGNQALGSPNLADNIWLYGGSESLIQHSIRAGRNGQMPAHSELLNPEKIHILAAYVYSLSN